MLTKAMMLSTQKLTWVYWRVSLPVWLVAQPITVGPRSKLPDFLSFFGGKRFAPLPPASSVWCWRPFLVTSGRRYSTLSMQAASGSFLRARWVPVSLVSINRLLIPTGLHQVLNTIAWFQIGEFTNAAGTVFHGDINRFYAGDGTAACSCPASSRS
ncbi:PTS transporter subunit EIIC [Escherichia coli]